MGEIKRTEPQSLRDGGKGLDEAGERVRQEWAALKQFHQGQGDIFGDDMVGGLLSAAYQAVEQKADQTFGSTSEDYKWMGEALGKAADNHDETQQRNVELIESVHAELREQVKWPVRP